MSTGASTCSEYMLVEVFRGLMLNEGARQAEPGPGAIDAGPYRVFRKGKKCLAYSEPTPAA